ncbi:MAG: DUF402 domain-containing protein, partial [Halobacteriales archaeon]|nr:DUF402 domain-containing protein [Halobacteriales archaeon]
PRGAVFDAVVTGTGPAGAVVDLGDRSGFLPGRFIDDPVADDDVLRVQVHEPYPPWSDDRPLVGTTLRAYGGLVGLERGTGSHDIAGSREQTEEVLRALELLSVDLPTDWTVRGDEPAAAADLVAIEEALTRAADRADTLESTGAGATPEATSWVWFGRESRFALDEDRRAVVPTMHGHHRIKAGTSTASAAVDFAERVYAPNGAEDFPFDAVTRQFGPVEGDSLALLHGKPDGHRFALGRGEVVNRDPDGTVTVRREMTAGGSYDALDVEREAGDVALTKVTEGQWWYPTVYLDADGGRKGTYVNICTPVEIFPDTASYVDLHVDVVKTAEGTVRRVDDDELDEAVEDGQVPPPLADKARTVADAVERGLTAD